MTDLPGDARRLARKVLCFAVASGSTRWARIHGYRWDCSDEQVHLEGSTSDGTLWRVDLVAMASAITMLASQPPAGPPAGPAILHVAGTELDAALAGVEHATISQSTADIALQLAAFGRVRYQ